MITTVCAGLWIRTNKNRLGSSLGSWYAHNKNWVPFKYFFCDHLLRDNICTYFLTVVNHVPKIFAEFGNSYTIFGMQCPIWIFLYTKQNHTSISICKSGIGLPE